MDVSPELPPDEESYFQTIIGVMMWMVELGHVDIAVEVSIISSILAMTPNGHMSAALHIISCLRVKHYSCLILDPTYADINYSNLK